jgi:hypothetical protein
MMTFRRLLSLFAALLLVACGGGGGSAGDPPFGGTPTTPPTGGTPNAATTVEVISSAPTVSTGGAQITITALVKGAGNASIPGAAVTFSTNTGTLLAPASVTDASGTASVKFTAGADRTTRPADITVTSGTASGKVTVQIVGTGIQVTGPQNLVVGAKGDLRVAVTDGANAPVAGVAVTVTSSLSNGLSSAALTTNAQGQATVQYTATNAGTDSVKFAAAGEIATLSITTTRQDNLSFLVPAPADRTIALNTPTTLTVQYLVNGAPASGNVAVRFAATSGALAPAAAATGIAVGANGQASATIQASFAGPATVQATLFNTTTGAVVAQALAQIQFVAKVPASVVLQITPKSVGPNPAGTTTRQAQVVATVTDTNGNPVEGAVVNFSKITDPSGGNLSDASAPTNAVGQATVYYISGPTPTASEAVRLRANVANNVAVFDEETLTVNQGALFIGLGTGNQIGNFDQSTYEKVWTAYVTDSSGAAVPNQTITVSVLPTRYRKGSFTLVGEDYISTAWVSGVDPEGNMILGRYFTCGNEDTNYDGIISTGEDINRNGRLDPGNVITVNGVSSTTTITTDNTGFALLKLRYAESYAAWVEVTLKASATVGGTESTNSVVFWVPGAAPDYTKAGGPPAGLFSPFGRFPDCTDSR